MSSPAPHPGRSIASKIITGLISSVLLISILLNVYLGAFFAASMKGVNEVEYERGDAALKDRRIVILPIQGTIGDETASFVRRAIKALKDNETKPAAIILRIDSPGGAVSPSDRIWHMLSEYKREQNVPIVSSFGGVAASGGYYVAAASDYIIAEPTTITGSIGVIAQAFTIQELLKKVGVQPEIIAATEATKKDAMSMFRQWTDQDRAELRVILDEVHGRFVDVVSEGRKNHLTQTEVKALATGAPFTIKQALEHKLVDEQGYLDAAIRKACELASLSGNPRVTIVQQPQALLSSLLGAQQQAPAVQSISGQQLRQWLAELSTPQLEYRWSP